MTSQIHTVNRAGVSIEIDIAKLSPEIIANLIRHGLTQKIGDAAAASAKLAAESNLPQSDVALSLMSKVRDALLAGDWGVTRAAIGVSVETQVQRIVTRKALKGKWGAKSPQWAAFTGATADEQNARLDAIWEKNGEKLRGAFDAEMKRRAIKASKVEVEIDF